MPRGKQKGVNKSAEIRAMLDQNPALKVDELVTALSGRGIKVSKNLAYLVKAKMHVRRGKRKRAAAVAAGRQAGVQNPVQLILKVRALANDAGGLKQLQQLVNVLVG